MGKAFNAIAACLIAIIFDGSACERNKSAHSTVPQVITRSRVSDGDLSRLHHVLAKARRGEPVTLGFIGGSITRGEGASSPDRRYANLVSQWWIDRFPNSKLTMVNAGVAGTNSTYGCLRVQRDLISKHPDLVVVEFGVNDKDDTEHAETYEGLIRQLMTDPDQPAVVLLFLMHHDGTNAQTPQSEIGRWYDLPMVSYRDALWPEIAAGRLKFSDITADSIHPNNRGHAAIATFVDSLLQATLDRLPSSGQLAALSPYHLPPPKFSDVFAHTQLIDAADIKPVANNGWSFDQAHGCWRSNVPGSTIEFQLTGQAIDILYEKKDGGYGTAQVSVDDQKPMLLDAWLNGSWGPLCQVDGIWNGSETDSHRVRIALLDENNGLSTGHEFRILTFGVAGSEKN